MHSTTHPPPIAPLHVCGTPHPTNPTTLARAHAMRSRDLTSLSRSGLKVSSGALSAAHVVRSHLTRVPLRM